MLKYVIYRILSSLLNVVALREKCFLVRIFPHSDWIQIDTKYLFLFSPNKNKDQKNSEYGHFSRNEEYGDQEKSRIILDFT